MLILNSKYSPESDLPEVFCKVAVKFTEIFQENRTFSVNVQVFGALLHEKKMSRMFFREFPKFSVELPRSRETSNIYFIPSSQYVINVMFLSFILSNSKTFPPSFLTFKHTFFNRGYYFSACEFELCG